MIPYVQMTFKPENLWKKKGNPSEQDSAMYCERYVHSPYSRHM